jgi:hypothetical protein
MELKGVLVHVEHLTRINPKTPSVSLRKSYGMLSLRELAMRKSNMPLNIKIT